MPTKRKERRKNRVNTVKQNLKVIPTERLEELKADMNGRSLSPGDRLYLELIKKELDRRVDPKKPLVEVTIEDKRVPARLINLANITAQVQLLDGRIITRKQEALKIAHVRG